MESSIPNFYIEKQESLAFDKFSRNGQSVDLHLVAKNIAFVIHVASTFDLAKYPPTAKLIYDSPSYSEEEKEVEVVKSSPLEIVSHVDESGLKAAVEVKIGVLSSQHEGAYFRIKFSARDPVTGLAISDYSQPIKVISKRNQVKKILERKQLALEASKSPSKSAANADKEVTSISSPIQASVHSPALPVSTPVSGSKRKAEDMLAESLARLEQQQQTQFAMLQLLLANQNNLVSPNASGLTQGSSSLKDSATIASLSDSSAEQEDFENAFSNFLAAYRRIPAKERAHKVRKISTMPGCEDDIAEFVNLFQDVSHDISSCSEKGCKCQDCPHKKELDRFDEFYQDFMGEDI